MGSQHISAGLLQLFKSLGGVANQHSLPEEYQFVEAEVLKSTTPLEVCRLAAGRHQAQQKDVQVISVADTFQFFVTAAREQKQQFGTEYFDDKDKSLAKMCRQLGLLSWIDKMGNVLNDAQAV